MLGAAAPSAAEEPVWGATKSLAPVAEVWSGISIAKGHGSLWSGMTYAPGSLIEPQGWRVRLVGGAGAVRSVTRIADDDIQSVDSQAWTDLLVGYQWRSHRTTLQLYGGLTFDSDATWISGYAVTDAQARIGAKVETNLWLDLDGGRFLKVDLGLATISPTLTGSARFGMLASGGLAVGPEARLFRPVDEGYGFGAGGFVRYEFSAGEVSASAGVMVDGTAPYVTFNFLTRY